jgi:site-specific DNA recombinase
MKKVIGYIRVSTEGQAESGLGLADQEMKIRGYCSIYDLELVDIVVDAGASAKNLNREGISRVIKSVESGEVEGVLVAKLDRLTRSMTDLHVLLNTVFSKVELHSVAEKVDTSTAAGRLVLNVLMSVAEWEREAIGERTSAALQAKKAKKAKKAESVARKAKMMMRKAINGRAPFGWQWKDGDLVPEKKEQEVIVLLKELRESGTNFSQIAAYMNEQGIPTSRNGKWQSITVKRILEKAA